MLLEIVLLFLVGLGQAQGPMLNKKYVRQKMAKIACVYG
jgi:hypothetical protein